MSESRTWLKYGLTGTLFLVIGFSAFYYGSIQGWQRGFVAGKSGEFTHTSICIANYMRSITQSRSGRDSESVLRNAVLADLNSMVMVYQQVNSIETLGLRYADFLEYKSMMQNVNSTSAEMEEEIQRIRAAANRIFDSQAEK